MMHPEMFSCLPLLTGSFKLVAAGGTPAPPRVKIPVGSPPGREREVAGPDDGGIEQVSVSHI